MAFKTHTAKQVNLTTQTIKLFYQSGKKYKRWFYLPMLMSPLGVTLDVLLPSWLVGLILGKISGTTGSYSYSLLVLALLFCYIGKEVVWRVCIRIMNRLDASAMRDLFLQAYDSIVNHSLQFHGDSFGGALVAKVNRFSNSFEVIYDTFVFDVVASLTILIASLAVIAFKAPSLLILMLIFITVFGGVLFKLVKKRKVMLLARAKMDTHRTAMLADRISNIQTIKSFASEKYERKHMAKAADDLRSESIKTWDYQNNPIDLFAGSFTSSIIVIAVLYVIWGHSHGSFSVAYSFLVINLFTNLSRRIWDFSRIYRNIDRALSDAQEMTEVMLTPTELSDPNVPIPLTISNGTVAFNNVDFWYGEDGHKKALFSNFNLRVGSGEKIGLVGPSGGGKTTITKLLLRFMDIQSGSITLDGQNIAKTTQHDVRQAIAYVPQEPLLFHRSIAENIAYSRPSATKSQIESAATKAHAHEFISKLPKGYDTLVGERGVKLSGGQRQRIAIARAMLKDAPILVLDEATSALDSGAEVLIQAALWELMKNKTVIVIAHRLSTIQKMDRIEVLQEGKIVEDGSHTQLLKNKKGIYAKLWAHQSGGFLKD